MSSHDHTPDVPETASNAVSKAEGAPQQQSGYRYYVLGILMFVFGVNVLDRQILAILMEPVRQDLGLTDTHLGFLSGIAFAIFYATLGIPIARIADRTSRKAVVSISLAAWSVMTALCGLAQNFWHLLLARIGVAVGEAGGTPPSHSLLADYFSENQRATALGIFSLGGPLGMMVGLFVAGLFNDAYGWRATFMLLGLPGVVLAIIIWLTIREPRREKPKTKAADPPVKDVFKMLWAQRSFRFMALATAIQMFVGYGLVQWYPAFFMRCHGLTTTQVGSYLALMAGISGGLGTLLGGYAADKFAARDKRWLLWLPMWATFLATPFYIGVFLVPNPIVAVCFMVLPTFLMNSFLGPIFSTTQGLVPSYMRATAAAVLLFVTNIIGLGLGPQAVGILSDLLRPTYGENSLRYALLAVAMLTVAGAYFFWTAARTLREDLERAKSMDN